MDLGLADKKALVLGASRGLGRAIAETLAAEGAHVIAAARNADTIRDWAADLPAGKVEALALDLTDIAAVDKAVDDLLAKGGVDILVNNIGGPPRAPHRPPSAATGSPSSRAWPPISSTSPGASCRRCRNAASAG